MVRIVALADTHLFHEELEGKIPDGDILVHAGDLLRHGSLDELARAADFFRALPHRRKIIVAGNHELCLQRRAEEARALLEGFVYLEDSEATVEGLRFYGSPWQPIFRVWAFGARRGPELAAKWAKIPEGLDVLVTHSPPRGKGDRVFGGLYRAGCADLAKRVTEVKPKLHLFGHIHQDPGRWEEDGITYANVTTSEGEIAAQVFDV